MTLTLPSGVTYDPTSLTYTRDQVEVFPAHACDVCGIVTYVSTDRLPTDDMEAFDAVAAQVLDDHVTQAH